LATKKRLCGAFVQTTGAQCRKRALPGASYCLVHLGKTPLLISALLGLAFSEGWRALVPSSELQELRNLKADIQPILNLARDRTPGTTDKEALEHLTGDLAALGKRTQILEQEVRSMEVEVLLLVRAEWTVPPTPGNFPLLIMLRDEPFIILYSDVAEKEPLRFFPINADRTNAEDGSVVVRFRAAIYPGRWPLGYLATELEGYRRMDLALPTIDRSESKTGEVTLNSAEITFSLNGVVAVHRTDAPSTRLVLPEGGWKIIEVTYPRALHFAGRYRK